MDPVVSKQKKVLALPNMVLARTYALNRSNSKRISIGLEFNGNFFAPVVKLCSSGAPHKSVTLDQHSWGVLQQQLSDIDAYLQEHYNPNQHVEVTRTVPLPAHDLIYTRTYGSRSIMINERTIISNPNNVTIHEDENNPTRLDAVLVQNDKKKFPISNGIVMQLATFIGFKEMYQCMVNHFEYLREKVELVNFCYKIIVEYLVEHLEKEEIEKVKNCLRVTDFFKRYYDLSRTDIEVFGKSKVYTNSNITIDSKTLDLIFSELSACYLPYISRDVHTEMFNSKQ